jgi:hypothetical protein
MDVEQLLKSLENENNSKFLHLTMTKINEMKLEILKELLLPVETLKEYYHKLKEYMYVDELSDLKCGAFLRWIPIKDPENIYLTQGAIFCQTKINDTGTQIVCKSFSKKCYQINMDDCLIFQKLSSQELVLLEALEYLSK